MKRSEAMLRLVLKDDDINIMSNRQRTTEDPCSSNDDCNQSTDKNKTNTKNQFEADKENFRSSNTPITIDEQYRECDQINASELNDGKATNANDVTGESSSSSSSSSSSDSSSSSSNDEDSGEDSDDSVRDPNFVAEQLVPQNSTDESDPEDNNHQSISMAAESLPIPPTPTASTSTTSNLSRKRLAKPAEWKQNKSKILRNTGVAYVSVKNVPMRERSVKPPCGDKCRLKCKEKITEDERMQLFQEYWGLSDITRQREFINQNMLPIDRKYRYTKTETGRMLNNAFYFTIMGQRVRVCKSFFMNTLDINSRVIGTVILKKTSFNTIETDKRGKHHHHHNLPGTTKESVRNHINSIPRIESHYLRNQTSREFIEGGKTIADLHRDYKELCIEKNEPYVNYVMYAKIFNIEFNLGFFTPKKDRCEVCVAYENSLDSEKLQMEEKYLRHQKEKVLSRQEKQRDKDNSSGREIVAVYDLQAVLPVPKGDVSVFYYKSKLNCLNFTITDIKNKKTECYFWHEGEGNRGSDEIGSCLIKFIEKYVSLPNEDDSSYNITFYSDNCSGQNKNKFIVALYIYCVLKFKNLKSITHKFLIPGHTQNEGDSVHSVIEKNIKRNLKSGPIYVPSQYAQIIKSAKKTGEQYNLNELSFNDFISLKKMMTDIKMTIGSMKINEVKVLKYCKETPDILYFKKSYEDSTFLETKVWRKSPQSLPEVKAAYERPLQLNERKRSDLLSLINNNHIPQFYSPFYQRVCSSQ